MKPALTSPGKNAFVSSASFRTTWTRCWGAYDAALRHCQKNARPHRVHALRTASRQLLALLAVLSAESPDADAQMRPVLEKVLRKSTRLRDLQVEVGILAALPVGKKHRARSLCRLKAQTQKRGKKFARRLRQGLGAHPDPAEWLDLNPLPAPEARFLAVLARIMERSRASARAQLAPAKSNSPRGRHRARLALKAHRYVCEAVLRPRVRAAELARLRSAQSAMGDRRDFERLLQRLRRWGRSDPMIDRLTRRNASVLTRRETRLVEKERQARHRLLLLSPLRTRKNRKEKSTRVPGN